MTISSINWDITKRMLALLVAIYLFSPLVSMRCFGFSQEVKACDIACLLVPCLVFVSCGLMRTKLVRISAIDLWLLCYAVFLFVRALLVWEELDRGIVVEYVACGGVYVLLRNADWRAVRFPVVLLNCAIVLLLQLWYGIAVQTDYFFPGKSVARICGSFLNTNLWSCFVACVGVALCVYMFFTPPSRWKRVAGFFFVFVLVLLYLGASRAAWLGFVVGCGYVLWKSGQDNKRLSHWGMVVLVLLVGVVAAYTRGKVGSVNGRLLIWKIAVPMFVERPWGWGIDSFRRHYMAFQENDY